jgi:deazaflavin-dependent oxidoreductase (nitroreductase family)
LIPLAEESFAYVTTTGRKSGLPREIEIWFAMVGHTIYLLAGSGDQAHWVLNIRRDPNTLVRIGGQRFTGRARFVDDPVEDTLARELLGTKYDEGEDSEWRQTALAIAIDLLEA